MDDVWKVFPVSEVDKAPEVYTTKDALLLTVTAQDEIKKAIKLSGMADELMNESPRIKISIGDNKYESYLDLACSKARASLISALETMSNSHYLLGKQIMSLVDRIREKGPIPKSEIEILDDSEEEKSAK